MEGVGAAVNELLDESRKLSAGSPLGREALDLLIGGNLTSEEEPEETLREGLRATGGGGELSLAVGDGKTTETDTLVWKD